MKLCASWNSSKMTRSRSILSTLAVLIILVVESSTQTPKLTTDSVVNLSNNDNTTQFNLDLQNPSTETGKESQEEPRPEQPIELNDPDAKNMTSSGIPFNNTTFEKNFVPSTTLDTMTELTTVTESIPEMKTTTYIPDSDTVTTVIPMNEDTPPAASSTIIQGEELHRVEDKTENHPEITTTEMPEIPIEPRKEDADFQSDSSNSSESEGSHSPQEENKATEGESSSSEDLSSEQVSAPQTELQNALLPDIKSTNGTVEEIGDVTESTGEISNDIVTEVSKLEMHTVMKKPGVDVVELSAEPTGQSVQEVTSSAPVTKNPLVNFILERTTEVPVARSQNTTDSNGDISAVQLLPTVTETSHDKGVLPTNLDENSISSDSPTDFDKQETPDQEHLNVEIPFGNSEIEMKLNEISYTENEPNHQTNHVVDITSTTTPPIKSNESTVPEGTQEDQPIDEENRIPSNEDSQSPRNELLPDVSAVSDKLLPEINQIKPSTRASSYDDVPMQTKKDEIVSTEFETSTEKPTVDEASLQNNQIKTSTELSPHDEDESNIKTSTESPLTLTSLPVVSGEASKNNIDGSLPDSKLYDSVPTENYSRHNDFDQTMKDETSSVVPNRIIVPASMGRAFNEIIPEGLGKPLPTRSVGDEPLSSSYSSDDDKTTTVLVLCAAAGGIFVAFSLAIYLISFQRQNGTLDIEMQEQRCGKDNLDEEDCDDDDSQTRVSLLNQRPSADSDEHSSY